MDTLISVLPYIQIVLALLLTGAILMQQRGAGLGSAFGGGDGTVHYERRGFEKTVFQGTVALAIVFVVSVALPVFFSDTTSTINVPVQVDNTAVENGIEVTTSDGETLTVDPVDISTTDSVDNSIETDVE